MGSYGKNEGFVMKNKTWLLWIGGLLALCVGLGIAFFLSGDTATHAEIRSDNQLIRTVDLRVNQTFTVQSEWGTNVITVQDGKIGVTEATCPDHYCMHRGYCNSGAEIVCLPNRLVIQFTKNTGIDGAVG